MKQRKPIICSFFALERSLQSVHLGVKAEVDRLHDVWMIGAPVPSTRIMQPKLYDPRLPQFSIGNVERRIVIPERLAEWIADVVTRRGMAITTDQALKLVEPISKRWG